MSANPPYTILFDGVCMLCNRLVRTISKIDTRGKFQFLSLQSEKGQSILQSFKLTPGDIDSIVLIKDGQYRIKSSAVLCMLKELGGVWKLCYALVIIPRPIRDLVYQIIAKNRYRIFGKTDQCRML